MVALDHIISPPDKPAPVNNALYWRLPENNKYLLKSSIGIEVWSIINELYPISSALGWASHLTYATISWLDVTLATATSHPIALAILDHIISLPDTDIPVNNAPSWPSTEERVAVNEFLNEYLTRSRNVFHGQFNGLVNNLPFTLRRLTNVDHIYTVYLILLEAINPLYEMFQNLGILMDRLLALGFSQDDLDLVDTLRRYLFRYGQNILGTMRDLQERIFNTNPNSTYNYPEPEDHFNIFESWRDYDYDNTF